MMRAEWLAVPPEREGLWGGMSTHVFSLDVSYLRCLGLVQGTD